MSGSGAGTLWMVYTCEPYLWCFYERQSPWLSKLLRARVLPAVDRTCSPGGSATRQPMPQPASWWRRSWRWHSYATATPGSWAAWQNCWQSAGREGSRPSPAQIWWRPPPRWPSCGRLATSCWMLFATRQPAGWSSTTRAMAAAAGAAAAAVMTAASAAAAAAAASPRATCQSHTPPLQTWALGASQCRAVNLCGAAASLQLSAPRCGS